MRLLVDENLDSAELMARLREAGHHVETPEKGMLDLDVWRYAQEHGLVLLTADPPEFESLASATRHHGLFVVYGERAPAKQMRAAAIASAIERVRDVYGDDLSGRRVSLNEWRRSAQ